MAKRTVDEWSTEEELRAAAAEAERLMRSPRATLSAEWALADGAAEPGIGRLRRERDARPPRSDRGERDRAQNAEFWARDDVRGARNALDVWASCKHARAAGVGAGVPTLEAVFEFPRAELWEPGSVVDLEYGAVRTSSDHPEAGTRLVELAVDGVLMARGAAGHAVDLLTCLYPRTGTYQRPEYSRDPALQDPEAAILRAFRTPEVVAIAGGVLSPSMHRKLDATLGQLHRELVFAVARAVAMPAEVYAADIRGIRVPERPRGRPRKSRTENERRVSRRSKGVEADKEEDVAHGVAITRHMPIDSAEGEAQ
jgi:hypothetical protein